MIRTAILAAMLTFVPGFSAEPTTEPKITSIYPFAAQLGKTGEVAIRGHNLKDARGLWFPKAGVQARVMNAASDLLRVELTVDAAASLGRHAFRVLTPDGI